MSRRILAVWSVGCGLILQPFAALAQKHVEVNKTTQVLSAYEGNRLVLQSRVSTGRWDGSTPVGSYTAGEKSRMHYSHLYHHAPMPYSVHVTGNVFIHGFTYVPAWPDSHGCIRMPLDGSNPAKRFFEWVESGTPIHIYGKWAGPPGKISRTLAENSSRP